MATVTVYQQVQHLPLSAVRLRSAADVVFKKLHLPKAIISIHCIGNARMRTLNRIYRGIDRPTDVLSFAAAEGIGMKGDTDEIGDVFLAFPYLIHQAKRVGVPVDEECLRMLIHGILHALGYDHGKKKDAAVMFSLQESLLKQVV
jgi:probable rRNA maturation factor